MDGLAIDQGTSSSRAIVFDIDGRVLGGAQETFDMIFPARRLGGARSRGALEYHAAPRPRRARRRRARGARVAAIGITNQRETTLVWERDTGRCVHNAIVWQDRRTAPRCQVMRDDGIEPRSAPRPAS